MNSMITLMTAKARSRRSLAGVLGLFASLALLASCSSGDSSQGLGALPKAMGAAEEASTIQALRTIATAEGQLKATRGAYGDFDALTSAGFLDSRFSGRTPNVQGYRFTISATDADFAVNADPEGTDKHTTTGAPPFSPDEPENLISPN